MHSDIETFAPLTLVAIGQPVELSEKGTFLVGGLAAIYPKTADGQIGVAAALRSLSDYTLTIDADLSTVYFTKLLSQIEEIAGSAQVNLGTYDEVEVDGPPFEALYDQWQLGELGLAQMPRYIKPPYDSTPLALFANENGSPKISIHRQSGSAEWISIQASFQYSDSMRRILSELSCRSPRRDLDSSLLECVCGHLPYPQLFDPEKWST